MMLFQRIFANEVKPSNRWGFAQRLGFWLENFVFTEELPGNTLRVLSFENGNIRVLLDATALPPHPKVVLRHSVLLPERHPAPENALTDFLLPFPWSTVLSRTAKPTTLLEFSDLVFKDQCERLRTLFQKLESALTQNEIACIQIENPGSTDAFIFHCVRGKIIRVSFFPRFVLGEHQKDLSQTSYSVTTLPSDNPPNLKGFELSFWQLEQALHNQKTVRNLASWEQTLLDVPLEL